MKLGLILKLTSEGEREVFSLNKNDAWGKYASDARTSIKELTSFDETAKMVFSLRFLGPEGILICIVKARPQGSGRPFDNTAAWIHIPAKMDISGEEIVSIIEKVKDTVSGHREIDSLKSVFGIEYPNKDILFSALSFIKSNDSAEFAERSYGNGTEYALQELLGDYIAQEEYNSYKGIFLLETSSGISLKNNNILKSKIKPICKVIPPDENMGFRANIGKPLTPFNKPIEVVDETKITVLWKKEGYSDIRKEFIASYENTNKSPIGIEIHPDECKRIVFRSWIKVYNQESNRPIDNFSITINGQSFISDKMEILESDFDKGVQLQVSCRGYEDNIMNNIILNDGIKIKMDERVHKKEYILPVEEGKGLSADARITIETKREYNGLPLKGYYSDHGDLRYSSNLKLRIKYFVLGFVSLICVGLLYAGYEAVDRFWDNHKICFCWPPIQKIEEEQNGKIHDNSDSEGEEISNSENTAKAVAIEYLENNPVWVKDSLEAYPYLEGLYEDLNEFKFDKLRIEWDNKLNDSQEFSNVINAIKKSEEKGWELRNGKGKSNGKYNSSTDKGITIKEYIEWISHEHRPATSHSAKSSDSENIPPESNASRTTKQEVESTEQSENRTLSNELQK